VEGCPVAYLVGHKEFFSLDFRVSPDVLIPRPDTEVLVMELLRLARPLPAPTLLDVGTGSGAIVVAALKNHPGMKATAVDCSPAALAIAAQNAQTHGVFGRLVLRESDLLLGLAATESFDFIVSNPPYIPTGALPELPVGVRDYEPRVALEGGSTGYEVTGRLLEQARRHLVPGGHLLLETGANQAEKVVELLRRYPEYGEPAVVQDHAGLPRVVRTRRG
jgi:release factor glutamine methyltransferase